MDTPEYETVWNGGPGLTTVGAQRLNAVLLDQTEGDVTDWMELARQRPGGHGLGVASNIHGIVLYDVADTPHWVTRWLVVDAWKKWDRLVRFARWSSWPTCHLCGKALAAGRHQRTFHTPYHRSACQSCYVFRRMSQNCWPAGARWNYVNVAPAERLKRQRASQSRYYYRQKAIRLRARDTAAASRPDPAARTPPADAQSLIPD